MDTEMRRPATVMFLRLLLYVLAFAAPTTVVAVLMPFHMAEVLSIGMAAFLATTALITGWQWDDPSAPAQIRPGSKLVFVAMLITGMWVSWSNVSMIYRLPLIDMVRAVAVTGMNLAALSLIPFYLGRAIHRKKLTGA